MNTDNDGAREWGEIDYQLNDLRNDFVDTTDSRVSSRMDSAPEPIRPHYNVGHEDDVIISSEKFPSLDREAGEFENPARFLIDSTHLKIFIRAVHSLMNFGEHMLFFPTRTGLTMKACNLTRTAAGSAFFSVDFFGAIHSFDFPADRPCIRMWVKNLITVLRKVDNHAGVNHFVMDMDANAEIMCIRIAFSNGISKTYKLKLCDVMTNTIPKVVGRTGEMSGSTMMAQDLSDALTLFGENVPEVAFDASERGIVLHTLYHFPLSNGKWRKTAARLTDLITLTLSDNVKFAFNIREIKALCRFANAFDTSIALHFKKPNAPLFAVVELTGICEITFTISTAPIEQSTGTTSLIEEMLPQVYDPNQSTTQNINIQSVPPAATAAAQIPVENHLLHYTMRPISTSADESSISINLPQSHSGNRTPNITREREAIEIGNEEMQVDEVPVAPMSRQDNLDETIPSEGVANMNVRDQSFVPQSIAADGDVLMHRSAVDQTIRTEERFHETIEEEGKRGPSQFNLSFFEPEAQNGNSRNSTQRSTHNQMPSIGHMKHSETRNENRSDDSQFRIPRIPMHHQSVPNRKDSASPIQGNARANSANIMRERIINDSHLLLSQNSSIMMSDDRLPVKTPVQWEDSQNMNMTNVSQHPSQQAQATERIRQGRSRVEVFVYEDENQMMEWLQNLPPTQMVQQRPPQPEIRTTRKRRSENE